MAGQHTEPMILYSVTGLFYDYDMDDLKESAFEQISVCCSCGEPMSLTTIHRDFSPQSEWNTEKKIPQSTHDLFSYIDDNAEALGLLQQYILAY